MSEASIHRTIAERVKKLKREGMKLFPLKIHGGPMQKAGIPDWHFLVHGRAVYLEVKKPGEEPTRLQIHRINEIREAGGRAEVVNSADEVERILKEETHSRGG